MNTPPASTAEKLPDPWLFDSEALLRELDRCRELTLQIPITNPNATHFGIQIAVDAQWNLRENLRYLLHLHREQQRSIRRQHQETLTQTLAAELPGKRKVVILHTPRQNSGKKAARISNRTHSARERFAKRRRGFPCNFIPGRVRRTATSRKRPLPNGRATPILVSRLPC